MEICIRPENAASLRIVQKLGFRYEGLRRRYIHIDGDWRDHYAFALTREDVPQGVLARWLSGQVPPDAATVPAAVRPNRPLSRCSPGDPDGLAATRALLYGSVTAEPVPLSIWTGRC